MEAKSKGSLLVGLAVIGSVWGCGGQTAEERDGGAHQDPAGAGGFSDAARPAPTTSGVSGSPDSATAGPMPTVDAAPPAAHDAASTVCTQIGAGGGGGNGECSSTFQEMCGGTNYQVSCACPRGSCVCFGLSTTVVSFTSCPSCPGLDPNAGPTTDDIFSLCGFPH